VNQRFDNLTGSNPILTLTASGSPHTKGSYGQLTAATPFDAGPCILVVESGNNSGGNYLWDVAIGAGGSEQIVLANLPWKPGSTSAQIHSQSLIPLTIPAGSRVAGRCQSSTGLALMNISVWTLQDQTFPRYSRTATYGAGTANSRGTTVTANANNTLKGNYAQIAAATDFDARWLLICATGETWAQGNQFKIDTAIGAGGSEQIIMADWAMRANQENASVLPWGTTLPYDVPAGSRIAIRARAETGSNSGNFLVVIFG